MAGDGFDWCAVFFVLFLCVGDHGQGDVFAVCFGLVFEYFIFQFRENPWVLVSFTAQHNAVEALEQGSGLLYGGDITVDDDVQLRVGGFHSGDAVVVDGRFCAVFLWAQTL